MNSKKLFENLDRYRVERPLREDDAKPGSRLVRITSYGKNLANKYGVTGVLTARLTPEELAAWQKTAQTGRGGETFKIEVLETRRARARKPAPGQAKPIKEAVAPKYVKGLGSLSTHAQGLLEWLVKAPTTTAQVVVRRGPLGPTSNERALQELRQQRVVSVSKGGIVAVRATALLSPARYSAYRTSIGEGVKKGGRPLGTSRMVETMDRLSRRDLKQRDVDFVNEAYGKQTMTPSEKAKVNADLRKMGLDGNGRFSSAGNAWGFAFDALAKNGMEPTMLPQFFGPKGTQTIDVAWKNSNDPFSPQDIKNTMLRFSWEDLGQGRFEAMAYIS